MNRTIYIQLLFYIVVTLLITTCSREGTSISVDRYNDQFVPEKFTQVNDSSLIKGKPLVLVMKDRKDSASMTTAYNIRRALNYAKIPFKIFRATGKDDLKIPSSVKVVCYTLTQAENLSDTTLQTLIDFVAKGNTLILTDPLWDPRMAYFEGIKPLSDYKINNKAHGFHFITPVLPGFANKRVELQNFPSHNGLAASVFMSDIHIIATAANDKKYPLIFYNKVGDGKVFVYNTSTINDKFFRGLVFSNIIEGLPAIPYLTANVSTIFLDDFPQPLYNDKAPPIKQEYNISDAQFVSKKWWPDMSALADSFHFKFTAMLVFNYNHEINPPFDFTQWSNGKVVIKGRRLSAYPWLMNQAIAKGYEIGYHGYNHISLLKKDWGSEQNMVASITAARKKWKLSHVGPMPVTYVPPNDYIDSLGIRSLVKGMPSIKYLCSTYTDSVVLGDGREFGPDPYDPDIFDYPRITSGYTNNNQSLFDEESVYIFSGIWTHFIHPDDVYDLPSLGGEGKYNARNIHSLGWHPFGKHTKGLYEVFRNRLRLSFKINPLLNILTARQAVPIVEKWRSSKVNRILKNGEWVIRYDNYYNKKDTTLKYWFMYVPEYAKDKYASLIKKQSVDLRMIKLWSGYLFEFNTRQNVIHLPQFVPGEQQQIRYTSNSVVDSTRIHFKQYHTLKDSVYADELKHGNTSLIDLISSKLRQNPGSRILQDSLIHLGVEFNKVDISISVLKKRIMSHDTWHRKDLDSLTKYLSWQSEEDSLWSLLKARWEKYPDIHTMHLERDIVETMGIPSNQFSKLWLTRDIQLHPGDMQLKSRYISLYQSQENWPVVKSYLKQMIRHNPGSDTLYHYALQHSFWYEKADSTLKWLKSFPTSSYAQLKPFNSDIAILYAYTGNNITKALSWAKRTPNFNKRTILSWYLDANRFNDFITMGDSLLQTRPQDASLRSYLGTAYLDNGYIDNAYETLYPLFSEHHITDSLKTRIQNELNTVSYSEQKKLYVKYPDLFLGSTKHKLIYKHRMEEGFQSGLMVNYSTDNFKNTVAKTELSGSWGNRLDQVQTLTLGYDYVSSDINNQPLSSGLQNIRYAFLKYFKSQTYQVNTNVGLVRLSNAGFLPDVTAVASRSGSNIYSSLTAGWSPVYTNFGVNKRYNKLNLALYNEYYLFNRHLGTSQSFSGNRYSNKVYSWELDGHIFINPWVSSKLQVKPDLMYSYSSASRNYSSGIPYWTPHNLDIEGAGLAWNYNSNTQSALPKLTMDGEMLINHDNQNGMYFSAYVNLNTIIFKYYRLGLTTDLSTSKVYRSNDITFNFSYVFPSRFK